MAEKYLYERLVEEFGKRTIAQTEISSSLKDNLNRNFELRSYQIEAFQRFICYYKNDLDWECQKSCVNGGYSGQRSPKRMANWLRINGQF